MTKRRIFSIAGVVFTVALLAFNGWVILDSLIMTPPETGAYGDWHLNCQQNKTSSKPDCFLLQNREIKNQGQQITTSGLQLTITRDKKTSGGLMTITTPSGVDLIKAMTLSVDDGQEVALAFHVCNTAGCITRLNMKPGFIRLMNTGTHLYIDYWPFESEQRLRIGATLAGFKDGYDRLTSLTD